MKTFLILISCAFAAPAAMAQDMAAEKVRAASLAGIFENACMSYGTDVEGARLFAHLNDLAQTESSPYSFYNTVCTLTPDSAIGTVTQGNLEL